MVFLLSSTLLFAQTPEINGLKKSDYNYCIFNDTIFLFTQKGLHKLTLNSKEFIPYRYQAEDFQKQTKSYFGFTSHKDSLFAIHPGGGILYTISNDSVIRIDKSRAHRNQYASAFFSFNDTLYNMGGYGLWNSKAYLTYFDPSTSGWEKIQTFGEKPINGFSGSNFIINNHILYLLGGNYTEPAKQKVKNLNSLLSFDLKSKTWLEPKELSAKSKQLLFPNSTIESAVKLAVFEDQFILYPRTKDPHFYFFDLQENILTKAKPSNRLILDNGRPLVYKNHILTSYLDFTDNSESLMLVPLPSMVNQIEQFQITSKPFSTSIILTTLILIIVFSLITLKIFKSRSRIILLKRRIYYFGKTIPITPSEYYFLDLLHQKKRVENKVLLDYFDDDAISRDMVLKRKNNMIESLTARIKQHLQKDIFYKDLDPKDKRQVIYYLTKGLQIIKKN